MARIFRDWLQAYLEFTQFSEAPDSLHFWTGVSTIAGALRRRVWIDQRHFEWVPNFYIIFVAPPGISTKSTSIGIGYDLLKELEGVHFGPSSATWQALTQAIAEAAEAVPATDAGLDGPLIPMSCVTLAISELGTLLDTENSQLLNVLTDLWDGRRVAWEHKTRTQEKLIIENPWVNLIGATTPEWMRENFKPSMIGGGLASRIIFVFASKKRRLVAYPEDSINMQVYGEMREKLLHDLREIASLVGPYILTPEAKEWGREWYERHWDSSARPDHLNDERFGGYIARKQTHIHKLAMVLAAARRNELTVRKEELTAAEQLISSLEANMLRVFDSISAKDVQRNINTILTTLKLFNGELSQQELFRRCINSMGPKDFSEAVDALVRAQYLKLVNRGRDGLVFVITPDGVAASSSQEKGH